MALNAYEVLTNNFPGVMPLLDSNLSVSGALQAYFTYVAHLAAEEKLNIVAMRAKLSIVDDKRREDNCFQAKLLIDFSQEPVVAPAIKVDKKILYQRNLVISQVMEVNTNIRSLARDLVVALEQLGLQYSVPWEDIRCGSKKVLVRRGGRRLEMDIGQKEWLPDEELDNVVTG